MMEEKELKKILTEIADNEYNLLDEYDYEQLTKVMLNKIGTVDSELRDELIYMIMANWIMDDVYNKDELNQILNICLDENHLYYKLGQKNDDSVFTRSFSALILAVLFHKDIEFNFIQLDDFKVSSEKIINYYKKEEDIRGFVEEKGWAHTAAHGADILKEIGRSKKADKKILRESLRAITEKAQVDDFIYFNGEDERIAHAVNSILKNKSIDDDAINRWFKELVNIKKFRGRKEYDTLIFNLKNLLKSLYFEIISDEEANDKYLMLITNDLKELAQKRFK